MTSRIVTSYLTQSSEEQAAAYPSISAQRFQKGLENQLGARAPRRGPTSSSKSALLGAGLRSPLPARWVPAYRAPRGPAGRPRADRLGRSSSPLPRAAVQRGLEGEARLRSQRYCCACGTVAMALFVILLTYGAFAVLADESPQLEETIVISVTPIFNATQRPHMAAGQEERVHAVTEHVEDSPTEATESSEVKLLKGLEYFCGTQECSRYAAFIQDQLDSSYDPCRNLYDHVCSRWQREHQDYASQEARCGTYTVDDAISHDFRDKLVRLLLSEDCPHPKVRRFFAACAHGNLTTRAELEGVMAYLRLQTHSVDALATAVAQMARLGVSPFFDISVAEVSSGVIRIELVPAKANCPVQGATTTSADGKTTPLAPSSPPAGARKRRNTNVPTLGADAKEAEGEFLATLERKLCLEVAQAVGGRLKNCTLSSNSRMSPPWDYEWYKTIGMTQLAREAEKLLSAAWLSLRRSDVGEGSSWQDPKRLNACLTLIARHDPYALSYLVGTDELPARLARSAHYHLLALQNMIAQKLGNRTGISLSLGHRATLQFDSVSSQYQTDIYGNVSDVPSLLRFLRNSTWKRWTGEVDAPPDAFAPSPFYSKAEGGAIVVPLTLLNATALEDPWLAYLSLARIAPRVVRTIFSGSRELAESLNRTRLAKCVPSLSPSSSTSPRGPSSKSTSSESAGGAGKDHDVLTELASFYAAFHFYRHYVGVGLSVPGTELSGDMLFLLYYVYNMCEAVTVGLDAEAAAAVHMRRERVRTLAKLFATVLFPACEVPVELADCDMESDDMFLPTNEVPRFVSAH
ncbi:uncharacterized protein [Dermacentor albipictus]|uniref:uncharacterized protein isoform X1 n=1 Tax=Dermacentor albipictus TaxID=60249 RepID=UPI0038FC04B5